MNNSDYKINHSVLEVTSEELEEMKKQGLQIGSYGTLFDAWTPEKVADTKITFTPHKGDEDE